MGPSYLSPITTTAPLRLASTPAPLHPTSRKLRNFLKSPPLQPAQLLIHSAAKAQKRPQPYNHAAGRSIVLKHDKPGLRSFTRHVSLPRLYSVAAPLDFSDRRPHSAGDRLYAGIRRWLGYLLDEGPSYWVHKIRVKSADFRNNGDSEARRNRSQPACSHSDRASAGHT